MGGEAIFIGYRRDDTADVAGRIYDALAARFGKARIFKDVDSLRPGANFGAYIKSVLPKCRVALILMGPAWLDVRDENGARRLDNANDWVRLEVETALSTPGLDVVPVLVNGARMPRDEELPESLRPLLERHAAVIRRDPDFHDDVQRLGKALRASIKSGVLDFSGLGGDRWAAQTTASQPSGTRRGALIAGVGAGILAAGGAGAWWVSRSGLLARRDAALDETQSAASEAPSTPLPPAPPQCISGSPTENCVERIFAGHTGIVAAAALSPDGTRVLTGSWDRTARLWNASDGRLLQTFDGLRENVLAVGFSHNGSRAFAGDKGGARVWDVATGRALQTITTRWWPSTAAISPDGSRLFIGQAEEVQVFDVATGQLIRTLTGHRNPVVGIAFAPDGRPVTGSLDGTARLWDVEGRETLQSFDATPNGNEGVSAVAISHDGTQLAAATQADRTRLFDVASGQALQTFPATAPYLASIAFSPNGRLLVTGANAPVARILDIASGRIVQTFRDQRGWLYSPSFSPDGSRILTADSELNTARIWAIDPALL
jgi:Tol biopolymer transport system component